MKADGEPVVSVVLPCLNEAGSVGQCVQEAYRAFEAGRISGEVIVVDNGSSDDSADRALAAGARVIAERRRGYGYALRAGIAAARGSVIVMADADWSYDLRRIPDLASPVLSGAADLVVGKRTAGIERGAMPFLNRYVGNPILSALVRRVSENVSVDDSQCGFRAFRAAAVRALGLRASGMEFASEMLIRAGQAGLRTAQVPINYRRREGRSKLDPLRDGWRHVRFISLLAPHLVLFRPGLALFLLGLGLSAFSLASPRGIEIGSLRWQPIFFSTIAMTLGTHGLLIGMLLTYRSTLARPATRSRFAFVGRRAFPRLCIAAGVAALAAGLGLDIVLFVSWVHRLDLLGPALAYASLAQSLMIVGVSTASFGLVVDVMLWADVLLPSSASGPELGGVAAEGSS